MGTDDSKSPTRLREYLAVLQQRDAAGQPFVIVGGHAANFWAEFYSEREPKLKALLPFTSKDLDLIGTEAEAVKAAKTIGWHLSPPPVGGGPVEAVLSSQSGGGLTVEFLSQIKGVSHETIVNHSREGVVHIPETGEPIAVRVLDPVVLLYGKIRNAVDIEQNLPDKPRQDVKHVTILGFCVPHFLEDVRTQAKDPGQQQNICAQYITMLASLRNTYSGRQFEANHPGVIRWRELIPLNIQQMTFGREIQASLRQLTTIAQSRGIGI